MWPLRFQYKHIHGNLTYLLLILYAGYSGKAWLVQNKSAEQEGETDRQIFKAAITIPYKSVMWSFLKFSECYFLHSGFIFSIFFLSNLTKSPSWNVLREEQGTNTGKKTWSKLTQSRWTSHRSRTGAKPMLQLAQLYRRKRDLQAQRRQVFLNNTSCLKATSAAPRVWQASSAGDLVP